MFRTTREFDDQMKREILSRWQDNPPPTGSPLREEWESFLKLVQEPNRTAKTGWAYVGINYGHVWDEKYFDWEGGTGRRPRKGDVLTATGSVNLRVDHIRYKQKVGWVNSPIVGVILPGDRVRVVETQVVAGGFHWIKGELIE